jgi:hypothetical protein
LKLKADEVLAKDRATDPLLLVTSERNDPGAASDIFQELGLEPDLFPTDEGESHFLCLFDEQGHHNLGNSNDWGDAEKFEVAALKILSKWLGEIPVIV